MCFTHLSPSWTSCAKFNKQYAKFSCYYEVPSQILIKTMIRRDVRFSAVFIGVYKSGSWFDRQIFAMPASVNSPIFFSNDNGFVTAQFALNCSWMKLGFTSLRLIVTKLLWHKWILNDWKVILPDRRLGSCLFINYIGSKRLANFTFTYQSKKTGRWSDPKTSCLEQYWMNFTSLERSFYLISILSVYEGHWSFLLIYLPLFSKNSHL